MTGEQISLLETASKLVGFLRWSGEKYKTSNDIRAHPACAARFDSSVQGPSNSGFAICCQVWESKV